MARKKRKVSETTLAYRRNRERIIKFIRRAEARGYFFDENILPPIPKRITKQSVKRLEKLTPEALYKKSIWVDLETGEFMSGLRRREYERSERSKKSAATVKANRASTAEFFGVEQEAAPAQPQEEYIPDLYEIAYDNVFDELLKKVTQPVPDYYVSNENGKRYKRFNAIKIATKEALTELEKILRQLNTKYTKSEIGKIITDNYEEIENYLNYILYGSDATAISVACTRIIAILNGGITLIQNQNLTAEAELGEDWEEP